MATIASKASGTGTAGDVTITKPTDTAVGDILVAFINSATTGTSEETHTGPSGWTKIQNVVPDNGSVLTVWAIVATSTEVAATDFSWASAGNNGGTVGAIFRIAPASGVFNSLALNVVSNSNSALTTTGITTLTTSNILLLAGTTEEATGADANLSAYTIANNDPAWTEEYDIRASTTPEANMGVASASYTLAQATGTSTVTSNQSGNYSSAIVSIHESTNLAVTGTVGVLNVQGIEGSVTAGAGVAGATGVINMVGNEGATTITASKWKNTAKSSAGTITNTPKS